jgi:hypothetical protein
VPQSAIRSALTLHRHGKTRNPHPNVDSGSGVLFHHYGVSPLGCAAAPAAPCHADRPVPRDALLHGHVWRQPRPRAPGPADLGPRPRPAHRATQEHQPQRPARARRRCVVGMLGSRTKADWIVYRHSPRRSRGYSSGRRRRTCQLATPNRHADAAERTSQFSWPPNLAVGISPRSGRQLHDSSHADSIHAFRS